MATYLVLRTTQGGSDPAERCERWARRTHRRVEVVGPVGIHHHLRHLLEHGRYAGAVVELSGVRTDDAVAAAIARADVPVVAVSPGRLTDGRSIVDAACARTIAGRGTGGFLWALWHLHALHEHPPRTLSYGPDAAHLGDLRLPDGTGRHVAVVLVHGGFWRHEWERDLMDGLALDLTRRGYATWNVEYRRTGPTGGGWPQTRDDVVRAVTSLAVLADGHVDLRRVVLLGHSAGAQLAMRAAAALRERYTVVALAVAMSGLLDLEAAARDGVGWGSVQQFLGGEPDEHSARYRDASPVVHVPLGVPQMLVHGAADAHVPIAQSVAYRDRARVAGDDIALAALDGVDHLALIDPTSDGWAATASALERHSPAC